MNKINQTPAVALQRNAVLTAISKPLAEKYHMVAVIRGNRIAILDTKKASRVCGYVSIDVLGYVHADAEKIGRQTLIGSLVVVDILAWAQYARVQGTLPEVKK